MEKDVKTMAQEINENIDAIKSSVESKAAKEDIQKLQDTITDMGSKGATKDELQAEFKKLEDIIEKQGKTLNELKEVKTSGRVPIRKSIEDKADRFQALYSNKTGSIDLFEQKAVALVTTASATTNTFTAQALANTNLADESNAGNVLRDTWIEQFASVSRINRPYYSYVDWKPKDGTISTTAEGAAKDQIDFKSVATQVQPVKIAAYIALTEESVTDVDELESVARDILFRQVMLARQSEILTYITGTVASSYTAGGSLNATVANPNLSDVVQAIATQIYTTENYTNDIQMMPNVAFVNPVDYYKMNRTKDANDNYVYPQFAGLGTNVPIIPKTDIAAGYVLVGDFTKLNIKNYIDYSVRLGWINTQFI